GLLAVSSLFARSGPHRYLHSFPTRRSSDLGQWSFLFACWLVALIATPSLFRRPPTGIAIATGLAIAIELVAGFALVPIAKPATRDRKSTRLNSSHDQTSYAVFCLKKKTKKS